MPFDVSQVDTDPVVLALVRAKARIADPESWCINSQARLSSGVGVDADHPDAVRFCAVGALGREYNVAGWYVLENPAYKFLNSAARELSDACPAHLNNTRGHAFVMAMFDKAIESARALALQAR